MGPGRVQSVHPPGWTRRPATRAQHRQKTVSSRCSPRSRTLPSEGQPEAGAPRQVHTSVASSLEWTRLPTGQITAQRPETLQVKPSLSNISRCYANNNGQVWDKPQGQSQGKAQGGSTDAEADMPKPKGSGAICVQRFDDSRNSAIHTTYRALLRSSSLWEPRNPLCSVILNLQGGHQGTPHRAVILLSSRLVYDGLLLEGAAAAAETNHPGWNEMARGFAHEGSPPTLCLGCNPPRSPRQGSVWKDYGWCRVTRLRQPQRF